MTELEIRTVELTEELNAELNADQELAASLEPALKLQGELEIRTVELTAELSSDLELTVSLEPALELQGELDKDGTIAYYTGEYNVIPKTYGQILNTKDKILLDNVSVAQVPYFQTSNQYGDTVYIASEV